MSKRCSDAINVKGKIFLVFIILNLLILVQNLAIRLHHKNSQYFIQNLQSFFLDVNYILVNFEAAIVCTNIPKQDTVFF